MIRLLVAVLVAVLLFGVSTAHVAQRTYLPTVRNGAAVVSSPDDGGGTVYPCLVDLVYDLKVPGGYEIYRGADISGPICMSDGSFLWSATGRRPDGFFGVLLFRQYINRVENVKLPRDVEGRGQLSREGAGVWLIAHDNDQAVIMRVSP